MTGLPPIPDVSGRGRHGRVGPEAVIDASLLHHVEPFQMVQLVCRAACFWIAFVQSCNPYLPHLKYRWTALRLPLFGREEDAADQFAGYIILKFGKDQARRLIEGAAYSAEEFMKGFGPMNNYASVHGLPQQRFYNLLCLAYGADPKLFADVTNNMMQAASIPKRRADNCEYEFQAFDHAFKTEIEPYVDTQMAKTVMIRLGFLNRIGRFRAEEGCHRGCAIVATRGLGGRMPACPVPGETLRSASTALPVPDAFEQ